MSQKYPWDTRWYRFKNKYYHIWQTFAFCALLMLFWLLHILIFGWFQYLFYPKSYVIKARYILEDVTNDPGKEPNHPFWWTRGNCKAAKKAAAMNESESYVQFTERVHPFFLDTDIFYVRSKGYKARWINEEEKVYPQSK